MKKYMLLQPDEDGNPISWIDEYELNNINQLKEDYGIEKFLENLEDSDPNYWSEGEAMLLEVKILKVKPKKVVEKWEIEQ